MVGACVSRARSRHANPARAAGLAGGSRASAQPQQMNKILAMSPACHRTSRGPYALLATGGLAHPFRQPSKEDEAMRALTSLTAKAGIGGRLGAAAAALAGGLLGPAPAFAAPPWVRPHP